MERYEDIELKDIMFESELPLWVAEQYSYNPYTNSELSEEVMQDIDSDK